MLAAVDRLASRGEIAAEDAARMHASSREAAPEPAPRPHSVRLPAPHPLDFDWRFDDSAVDYLFARAGRRDGRLVTLGAPSIFRRALELDFTDRVRLVDSDASLAAAFRGSAENIIHCDLLVDEVPALSAGVVVADPPWYPAHIRAFLWAARQIVSPQGEVLLSMPPLATRPGVADERADLLGWIPRVGLRLTEEQPGALLYRTPPFERAALRAEGILCPTGPWRRGDLWVLVPDGEPRIPRPQEPGVQEWVEVQWHGVRIRFRHNPGSRLVCPDVDPRPIPLILGDVLPSVSRRHPIRPQVDVWTSGNRIFGCRAPTLLAEIAAAASGGASLRIAAEAWLGRPLSGAEPEVVKQASDALHHIVEAERADYADTYDR